MIEEIKPFYNAALKPFARLLARMGIHPNVVTLFGVFLFFIGAWLTAIGIWKSAVLLGVIAGFFDGLDGIVARETGKKSSFGALLDSVCDRLTEVVWLGGYLVYFFHHPPLDTVTIYGLFLAITGSLLVSYVKARAEGVGIACDGGLLQRTERLIILGVFQLLGPQLMLWGLCIVAVFAYLTVFQRLYIVWRKYKKMGSQ